MAPDLSIDDAKAVQTQSNNQRDTPGGIPDEHKPDYDTETVISDVSLSPEVMVTFDHVARMSIQDYGYGGNILQDEQNLQGAGKYGYDVEITVANPEIVDGQLWTETDAEYPSHRIIGDVDAATNPYDLKEDVIRDDDGNVTDAEVEGVSNLPGGNSFAAERAELDADFLQLSVRGSRGADLLGQLDTAGQWFTGQDGDIIEGLFEVPPEFGTDGYDAGEHGHPRLTGYPELREDMVGQRGAIVCTFADDATEADTRTRIETEFYKVTDDGLTGLPALTPDDDTYAKPAYPRTNNQFWDGTGGQAESSGGVEQAQSVITGENGLARDEEQFVSDAVDTIEAVSSLEGPEDFEEPTFAGRVESYGQTNTMSLSAEEAADIVRDRLEE